MFYRSSSIVGSGRFHSALNSFTLLHRKKISLSHYRQLTGLLGGQRPPVSGRWSVVGGQWSVVSGQWLVVSGWWSVVSGQWSMVTVSGQLSVVYSLVGGVGDLSALLHLESAEAAAAQRVVGIGGLVTVGHRLPAQLDTHLARRTLLTPACRHTQNYHPLPPGVTTGATTSRAFNTYTGHSEMSSFLNGSSVLQSEIEMTND